MRRLEVVGTLAAFALGACGPSEESPDGSLLFVPAAFNEAKGSRGHRLHLAATLTDGGRLECRSCHDLDREGFVSPQTHPCRRCHEDEGGFHHGPSDGGTLPDGGVVSCLTCHPFSAAEAATPSTPWVCLRCHAQPIGNAVAVVAHGAACFFCHQPHREPFTQPTECTICHQASNLHGVKAEATVVKTCMKCHERHSLAAAASKQCVACHSNAKEQKTRAAVVTRVALSKGHPSCGTCHVPHEFKKKDVKPCTSCHDDQVVLARAYLSTVRDNPRKASGHARCIECHDPHQGNGLLPKPCEECHQDIKNSHPAPEDHPEQACTQCHPMHQTLPGIRLVKDCVECHQEPEFAGLVHGKDRQTGESLTCRQCHPQHGFGKKMTDWTSCKQCHLATVLTAAKMRKGGHTNCEDCHEGLPHKPSLLNKTTWTKPKLCLSCHEKMQPPQESHDECDKCHETHSGARLKGCVDCHPVVDLTGLHTVARHQKCDTCHAPHGVQPFSRRRTCLPGCHEKEASHEPKSDRCHTCHLFRPPRPGDIAVELNKRK